MLKTRMTMAVAVACGLMAGSALAQNVSKDEIQSTTGQSAQQGNPNPRSDPATMREEGREPGGQNASAQNDASQGSQSGQKAGQTQEGGKTRAKKGTQSGPAPSPGSTTQGSSSQGSSTSGSASDGASQSSADTTGQGQGVKDTGGAAGTKTPKQSGNPVSSQHETGSPKPK